MCALWVDCGDLGYPVPDIEQAVDRVQGVGFKAGVLGCRVHGFRVGIVDWGF